MKRISVDSQMARIDVTTINAKLSVRSPKRSFRVKNTQPEMNVNVRKPTFAVDSKRIRAQRGLDSPDIHARKTVQKSKGEVMQGTHETAALGEETLALASTEQNVMANRAKRDMSTPDVNVDVPSATEERAQPEIIEGSTDIEWDRGDLDVKWSNGKWMPQVDVEPYSVEVNLEQKPSVRVTVHDDAEFFHKTSGRKLDEAT